MRDGDRAKEREIERKRERKKKSEREREGMLRGSDSCIAPQLRS